MILKKANCAAFTKSTIIEKLTILLHSVLEKVEQENIFSLCSLLIVLLTIHY